MGKATERLYNRSPVWLQNLLVTAYGYNLYRKRYSGNFSQILELVRASRTWSLPTIEAYQSEKLHLMVKHCRENVPYYQKLFADIGLHENDVTSTSDLARLPTLDKQTLKARIEEFRTASIPGYMTQHTSGSTGTPLSLEVDEFTYKLAMALLVDHEEHHGVPFGARRATFAGRMVQPATNMNPPFARINRAENQKLFSSYHLNETTFPWYQQALDRFQPQELIGYPSAISDLANHYRRTKQSPGFQPVAIITNSETLLDWQRDGIEQVFRCPVWDYYGTAEYVLFAGQEAHGYRLNPVIGIIELRHDSYSPATGCELLATTLTNRAMPLLRYEIGDRAESPEAMETKTVVAHEITRFTGRVDDYIELKDGRRIGRIDHIFKGMNGIKEAQVVQRNLNCNIKIVTTSDIDKNSLAEAIKRNFDQRTGGQLTTTVEFTNEIRKNANGKFKSVIKIA